MPKEGRPFVPSKFFLKWTSKSGRKLPIKEKKEGIAGPGGPCAFPSHDGLRTRKPPADALRLPELERSLNERKKIAELPAYEFMGKHMQELDEFEEVIPVIERDGKRYA